MQGKAKLVVAVPTLDTNIYASGDGMGPAVKLKDALDDSGDTGRLVSVAVVDAIKQKKAFDILLFNAEPTIASADNAALDIADAEMVSKFLGRVVVATADYTDISASSFVMIQSLNILVQAADGSSDLWAVLVSRDTPTYTGATNLTLKLGFIQD